MSAARPRGCVVFVTVVSGKVSGKRSVGGTDKS